MTSSNLLTEQAAQSVAYKIVSSAQVRSLEPLAAKATGCEMFDLMCRAGEAAFQTLCDNWPKAQKILVIAGNGNNAGDGYVLATLAKQQGMNVVIVCEDPRRILQGDAKLAQTQWIQIAGVTQFFSDADYTKYDVVVDALLGTGVKGQVKELFQSVIQRVNQSAVPVLSIDLPSGINADTGQPLPVAIEAHVTICFVAIKPGLVTGVGKTLCGTLKYADLDIGPAFFELLESHTQLVNWSMLRPLTARPLHANKGSFGKLLCVGGNQGMAGAIRLSAESALRSGVGLVKVFCHSSSASLVAAGRPEIILVHEALLSQLQWCTGVVIGPGLDQDDWAHQQLFRVLEYLKKHPKPIVIDADALNLLAQMQDQYKQIIIALPSCVLTPHPGEASRLLDVSVKQIESNRYQSCNDIGINFNSVCLLKGAGTVICKSDTQDSKLWVCDAGNPGMATAGMGDLLTGVIGTFLAQGYSPENAAVFAVCAHAEAGDRVATQYGQRGMISSDLLQPLRAIFNGL